MALTTCSVTTSVIAALDDLPNDVGGLTAAQLKAKFDEFGTNFVDWFNETHLPEVDAHLAEADAHLAEADAHLADTTQHNNNGQLTFPATQNPSSDPNVLDDYEEGVWTPVLSRATTASEHTYVSQIGLYTKIGNIVKCSFQIRISATTTAGSGANIVTGFPFAVSGSFYYQVGVVGYNDIFSTTGAKSFHVAGTAAYFHELGPTQGNIDEDYKNGNAYLSGNVVYMV
jgi:hypothetical protein